VQRLGGRRSRRRHGAPPPPRLPVGARLSRPTCLCRSAARTRPGAWRPFPGQIRGCEGCVAQVFHAPVGTVGGDDDCDISSSATVGSGRRADGRSRADVVGSSWSRGNARARARDRAWRPSAEPSRREAREGGDERLDSSFLGSFSSSVLSIFFSFLKYIQMGELSCDPHNMWSKYVMLC